VKQTDASGGYGMLIGPKSTKRAARIHCKNKTILEITLHNLINLSRVPTLTEDTIEGRHVDLRPYALYGDSIKIIPGSDTCGFKKGSIVVNSSQGGGKDTWILNN
jgi:uncharacterized circularly permuted ATP-grasp superfamily protein